MFTIDQNITYQKIKEKDMIKAFFSMNNHQIATPEMMLEEARSYIMFFHETGGKLSAYIGLHLLQSGRKLFYAHSSNPFQTGEMESVEEEALGFVEGLGGLLDAIDFTKMSSEEKNRWIDNQDLFIEKPEPESPAEEKPKESEQQEASSVHPEPHAPQIPSSAPESASETQPPQMQPSPPAQYAPQAPQQPAPPVQFTAQTPLQQFTPQPEQATSAPPMPDMPQSQQVTQAPFAQQVPPTQYAPQAPQQFVPPVQYIPQTPQQQPPPPAAPMQYTPQVPQQAPPLQYAPPTPQQPVPPATYAPQTPPVLPAAPPKGKQEIMQKAIKAGVIKAPKQSIKKEAQSAVGVVSRDREALARLLTSF